MKKLAIVGTHPETREKAPFDDLDYEIWVFNEAPQAEWCRRWDACFQLHRPEVYSSENNFVRADHWDWLQGNHGARKIYMQAVDARVPNSVRYPLEEVLAAVPGGYLRWVESSPAYALALALWLGYEEIALYGVELSSNTEYSYQLNNWQFWVGVAIGAGVKLEIRGGQVHFAARLYAYEGEVQIEREFFSARAAVVEEAWRAAEKALKWKKERLETALLDRKQSKFSERFREFQEAAIAAGEVSGALAEAQRFAGREDPISRQEFERRSAMAQTEGEEKRALMYHAGGKVEYVFNVWLQTGNFEALKQVRQFLGEVSQHAFDMGGRLGIHRENLHYMQALDERITAAGGARTVKAMEGRA